MTRSPAPAPYTDAQKRSSAKDIPNCPACEGTGKKIWKHREHPNHSCGGVSTCPKCQGTGKNRLEECNAYRDDEEGVYCIDSAERCRFKHRKNCPRYISVIDHQIECDKRNGTNFAEYLMKEWGSA